MLSVTDLTSHEYCPRKFFLVKVLKLSKPPKEALIKGSIRHEIYDRINKKEKEIVIQITKTSDLMQTEELFKKNYSEIVREVIRIYRTELEQFGIELGAFFKETWPLISSESKLRALNAFKFAQKHNLFGEQLWHKLSPKIESEFYLESKLLGLKGIIDQIEIYETEIVPYEIKSGKVPEKGVWPNHKIQTGAYILMLEETHKKQVKEAFVKYLESNETRQVIMNAFLKQDIMDLILKINETLASKQLPAVVANENKCKSCELKKECGDDPLLRSLLLNNRNL
jgi:CRISPR-associated protein Cas4